MDVIGYQHGPQLTLNSFRVFGCTCGIQEVLEDLQAFGVPIHNNMNQSPPINAGSKFILSDNLSNPCLENFQVKGDKPLQTMLPPLLAKSRIRKAGKEVCIIK
jgi:hypothetical protein